MIELRFVVPGSPVPKARPRAGRVFKSKKTGKLRAIMFTPKTTADYERKVATYARQAIALARWTSTEADRFDVAVFCYWGDRRYRDLDNGAKAILDAMNEVVYPDDSQIDVLTVYRGFDKLNPRAVVLVGRRPAA